jgi:hypothetical protein
MIYFENLSNCQGESFDVLVIACYLGLLFSFASWQMGKILFEHPAKIERTHPEKAVEI